jgi:hypothetical protein
MKKLDYFKEAISYSKIYENKEWYIKCFNILLKDDLNDEWKNNPVRFDIVKKPDGIYYVDIVQNNNETPEYTLIKIDDAIPNEALLNFTDPIEIKANFLPNVKVDTQTLIGNVIINAAAIVPCFGDKIEFINGSIVTSTLESIIVPKINKRHGEFDKERPGEISLKSFLEFVDRISFFTNISKTTVLPATEKSITVSKDFQKKKAELLKKYEGKLNDPVEVVKYEKELLDLHKEYLKDDPTYGKMLSGKVLNVASKRMFLSFGDERTFENKKEAKPVLTSLEEGWDTSEDVYKNYINSLRSGSYARGAETVKGGVAAKVLLRSIGGLKVQTTPCDTKRGLVRTFNEKDYVKLVDRFVKSNGQWKHIENQDDAKQYIGKEVEVRSPMWCTATDNSICYACLAERYKEDVNGITTLSLEISNTILYMFMKLMHGVALDTVNIELDDMLT